MLLPNQKCREAEAYVAFCETGSKESCPLVQYLRCRKSGAAIVENDVTVASEIYYGNRQSKYLMEGLLLAPDGTVDRISEVMRVRREVVEAYRSYFFDPSVFRNNFDVLDYVSELTDEREKVVKKHAITEGFSFVITCFTGGTLELSAGEMLRKLASFSYGMACQAKGHPVTSEVAREAKNWVGLAKSFAEMLDKKEKNVSGDFVSEFKVILEKGEPFLPIGDVEGDIVRG